MGSPDDTAEEDAGRASAGPETQRLPITAEDRLVTPAVSVAMREHAAQSLAQFFSHELHHVLRLLVR